MSPRKLAELTRRHDPRHTLHGMRRTPELEQWITEPRKWISLTTWNGQDFVLEDK